MELARKLVGSNSSIQFRHVVGDPPVRIYLNRVKKQPQPVRRENHSTFQRLLFLLKIPIYLTRVFYFSKRIKNQE